MSVTRNMMVKTAISHLARYSFLVSDVSSEDDDNDDGEDDDVFKSYDMSLFEILFALFLLTLFLHFSLCHADKTRLPPPIPKKGECSRGSTPATSVQRETRALLEYSYELPVAMM